MYELLMYYLVRIIILLILFSHSLSGKLRVAIGWPLAINVEYQVANMRISKVLPIAVILVSLLSMTVFFLISFATLKSDIEARSAIVLENVLKSNIKNMTGLFSGLGEEIVYQSNSNTFIKAIVDLKSGWNDSDTDAVKAIYQRDDSDRSAIVMAEGEEMYEYMHEAHHPSILNYVNKSAFTDVLILDPDLNVIYSALKGAEFGINLADGASGEKAHRSIAEKIVTLSAGAMAQTSFLEDPQGRRYAYLVTSIMVDGAVGGYLVGKIAAGHVAHSLEGFGMVGESGAISAYDEGGGLIASTLTGGADKFPDYNAIRTTDEGALVATATTPGGDEVTFAATRMSVGSQTFRIVVQEINAEIYRALDTLVRLLAVAALLIAGIVSVIVVFGARILSRPLSLIADSILRIAHGDADAKLEIPTRFHEIRLIASSLSTFRENALEKARLETAARQERLTELAKQQQLEGHICAFKDEISDVLHRIGRETEAMRSSASILSEAVQTASREGGVAHQSTEQASSNVQLVAKASQEMSASIQEIGSQSQKANNCVEDAVGLVEATSQGVEHLSQASGKIGAVVELIRTISEKTKMLALNARIEASRAGDAGKSFVIVANEVRTLSEQTARATDDIESQIKRVQSGTAETVKAIRTISDSMRDITGTTSTIAAAVEEQEISTQEISQSISRAADGSGQALQSVESVAEAIGNTDHEANRVLGVSDELAAVTLRLSESVEQFLVNVAGSDCQVQDRPPDGLAAKPKREENILAA